MTIIDFYHVDALRDYANIMSVAYYNIESDTQKLLSVINSFAEELEIYKDEFQLMKHHIEKSLISAKEPIMFLAPRLELIADRIEAYITSVPLDDREPQKE